MPSAKDSKERAARLEFMTSPQGIILIEDMCRNGATDKMIYERFGVSKRKFYEEKEKNDNFARALQMSKDLADSQVEAALFNSAINGNVTAQVFWLKNRRRNAFRDNPTVGRTSEKTIDPLTEAFKTLVEKKEGKAGDK